MFNRETGTFKDKIIQLIHCSCPYCKRAVTFFAPEEEHIIEDERNFYKAEMEKYRDNYYKLLNSIINKSAFEGVL